MKSIFAAALLFALAGVACADNCRTVTVAPVYAAPAYAAPVVPLVVHAAIYTPPDLAQDPNALSDSVRELTASVRELAAELARLKASPATSAKTGAAKPADPLAAMRTACLACHSPAAAQGGLVMFTDDAGAALAAMAPRDKRYAASLIEAGIMPKAPRKLDAAEKASVVEFLRK